MIIECLKNEETLRGRPSTAYQKEELKYAVGIWIRDFLSDTGKQ